MREKVLVSEREMSRTIFEGEINIDDIRDKDKREREREFEK